MKDLKVVIFILSSVVLYIVGHMYLCRLNIFSNRSYYHFYVKDVSCINKDTIVYINGMNVGHVSDINFSDSTLLSKITISLRPNLKLNENSEILITGIDLGLKKIEIRLNDGDLLKNNSEIKVIDESVKSADLIKKTTKILDNFEKISEKLASITKNVDTEIIKLRDNDVLGKVTEITNKATDLINKVKIPWLFRK